MKTKTIKKRLEKLVEKNIAKKGTCAYRLIDEMCEREKDTIRPVWTSGSGRYTSNLNYTGQVCYLLDKMKVMYEIDNDAPRGGACGTFIKILNFEIDKEKIAQWKLEEEERAEAEGNEKSLYHIIKPEIDFPVGTDEHDECVYSKAAENFQLFQDKGWLVQDSKENYFRFNNMIKGFFITFRFCAGFF